MPNGVRELFSCAARIRLFSRANVPFGYPGYPSVVESANCSRYLRKIFQMRLEGVKKSELALKVIKLE